MGEFIQELIREQSLVGFWDFRSGHTQDLSQNNSNNGVINGNCRWEGDGLRFVDNTAYVEVAHHASLNLTNATFVLLKPKQRSQLLSSGGGNNAWLSKLAGGAGTTWYSYLGAHRLVLYDGTATQTTGAAYYDDERYIALSLAAGGGTAIGYQEGLSVGNFGGANTLPVNTHNLRIGIRNVAADYDGTIQSVMIINRVLSAAEHAVLYQELAELPYPTSFYSFAKFEQDVFKRDPQLISGWNLKPTGGQVADEITTRDLTTINQMVHKPGILGEGMSGPIEGYLATANDPYLAADFATNGLSVECWLRPAALPAGNNYLFDYGGRIRMRQNGTTILWEIYDSAAAWQSASGGGALRVNELMHIVGTAKANGDVKLYIEGTLQGVTDTMLNFNIFAGRSAVWGAGWDYLLGIDADLYKPRIYDYELSQEEVSAKYLEGAQAVQFSTGEAFQVSPSAEGGVLHQQIGTRSSPFRAGDAAGRWKIETDTVDGQLCKVLTCTTAGDVYVSASLFFDATSTEAAFGTWSWWQNVKGATGTIECGFVDDTYTIPAAAGAYITKSWFTGLFQLIEMNVANLLSLAGVLTPDIWQKITITRSSAGEFKAYLGDTWLGTASDLTLTSSSYLVFGMTAGDKIALNPSGIVKRLGVFPP